MQTIEFKLQTETIELAQLLKACGIAPTGGHAKTAIQSGDVCVDGTPEIRRGCKLRAGQTITFSDYCIVLQ